MDKILIRGLEISACHGVHGFEKERPQRFVFDADAYIDLYSAGKSDDLEKTVSYSDICSILAEITRNNTFNLIEKLAYECAFSVMEKFTALKSVNLVVFKPDAPVKFKFGNVGVGVEIRREKAYLSLGSSIGDRKSYLDAALDKLSATRGIAVTKVSSYLENSPYGGVATNDFLNCAAEIDTLLSPEQLLGEIHRIEAECGRVRDKRWGDRTLDIDIIFFGSLAIRTEKLTIPHPDWQNRDFVKVPLKEIAPFLMPSANKI